MKIKFDTDDNLPLSKPLKLPMLTIIVRSVFQEEGKFYPQVYLDGCNMTVNIKASDSSLLEINKLSFKGVFSLSIYYIKYIPTKSPNHMNVYDDKHFLYLFLEDVDGHIDENNGIKYLVFTPTEKSKEELKNYKKLKVMNDDEPIENKQNFMRIRFESDGDLPLSKTFNILEIIIAVVSVLEKKGKYPQTILHECVYKL